MEATSSYTLIRNSSKEPVKMVTNLSCGNYSKSQQSELYSPNKQKNKGDLKGCEIITIKSRDKLSSNAGMVTMDELVEYLKDFKIRAIRSQNCGTVIRIKKFGCRHIHFSLNLNSDNYVTRSNQSTPSSRNDSFPSTSKAVFKMENGINPLKNLVQPHTSNLQSVTLTQDANLKSAKKKKKQTRKLFPPYWSHFDVEQGLLNGELIKGAIRINPKNSSEAYVNNSDPSLPDYMLSSVMDRNRALEGDIVIIKLKPEEEWNQKQKTAFVVRVEEKVHSRLAVGQIMHNTKNIIFLPRDKRIPKIKLQKKSCPVSVQNKPNVLLRVKIRGWSLVEFAEGIVLDVLGIIGDLSSELGAILAEHDIDVTPYSSELLQHLTYADNITDQEVKNRIDLRKECIFTIDPLTARDLDDAVSCRELPNGNFEVGVHISDVTFYLTEGTPLDAAVSKKATSVYFVNNVYHMLPSELCMQCSLLPGTNKRAFSIVWEMTTTGTIISQCIARSIINSCTQLAYEHAQLMIENPDHIFTDSELPTIHGGYTCKDISTSINNLQKIALNLRKQRFDNGALKINQTKLLFRLNEETGEPTEFFTYENKDAHRLIEEFMLLANISVAQKIVKDFPNLAFLRCHDPPKESMLVELKKNLNTYDIHLDISSSKAIQASIKDASRKLGVTQITVLNHLLAKPMNRARYFCAETQEGNFEHYALHVPIYTHFTSPIRRYADIMVHRLLSASLGYVAKPNWTVDAVSSIAANCNKQKYSAKLAGDASSNLYLAHYVESHQPFVRTAVVFHVRNRSFDILVPATGSIVRIYEEAFEKGCWKFEDKGQDKVIVTFPATGDYAEEIVIITMFKIITVNLSRKPNTNLLAAKMLRPISSQLISNSAGAFQIN